jgi:hypothetical protein
MVWVVRRIQGLKDDVPLAKATNAVSPIPKHLIGTRRSLWACGRRSLSEVPVLADLPPKAVTIEIQTQMKSLRQNHVMS